MTMLLRRQIPPPPTRRQRALRGLGVSLFVALVVAWVWLVTGCGPGDKGPATFTPAPRATTTVQDVLMDAERWRQSDPLNRYWARIAPTGSMRPFFDEHSVVLCYFYRGQTLPNGSVVIFRRGDAPRVMHVVADQTADAIYMSGYANNRSDGWFPKSTIEGYVVGQLYTP